MNFVVNLIAAVGLGFSVVGLVAGQQALGASVALLCCLVVLFNEGNAAKRPRRRAAAAAAVGEPAEAEPPLRVEIERLRRRIDELERAMLATGPGNN